MPDDELIYLRTLPAGRHVVFDCMTDPMHLAAFWGPAGSTTPLDGIVVELQVGGRFETLMVSDADGSTHHMRAVFEEVRPPDLLAWTDVDTGMATTVTFRDAGPGSTEVRIHQKHVPEWGRTPEARAGFATSLDRFERYLHALREES